MTSFVRRVRGTLGMGLTWAVGWALGGIGIGVTSLLTPFLPWDAFFAVFDAPLPALAVPGFVGGVLFSLVLRVAARHRRLDDCSLRQFAAWGAIGGIMLSLVPDTMVLLGLATRAPDSLPLGLLSSVLLPPLTLASAGSAAAALWMARRARGEPAATPFPRGASAETVDDLWLTDHDAQALLRDTRTSVMPTARDATVTPVARG